MISDTLEIETPFYDVDSCNVVWHGHYVKYFERARCKLLDKIGYNYDAMRRDGYFMPVVDLQIRYVKPLIFSQHFVVNTSLVEWENRLRMDYLIRDIDSGEKLTRASTTQVTVEMPGGQMLFQSPPTLISKIELLL